MNTRPVEYPFPDRYDPDLLDGLVAELVETTSLEDLKALAALADAELADPASSVPAHRSAVKARVLADACRTRELLDIG